MNIALIGYGEVGRILAEDLRAAGHAVSAFDLKLATADAAPLRQHAAEFRVSLAATHADAVRDADLTICAVTASQTLAAAQACAGPMKSGSFYLDFNSASPGAKIAAAALIDATGARYIEAAVMNSIPPPRIKVPLLLGGSHAAAALPLLRSLGFVSSIASEKLGVASATKMCRSVMIKGLEAMVIESFTTARHYGVEDAVIASLQETFPTIDWEKQGAYFFQRVIKHGKRRAEEVREVAVTVREAGLEPFSAAGTAQRQAFIADLSDTQVFGTRGSAEFARSSDWRFEADRLLRHLKTEPKGPHEL